MSECGCEQMRSNCAGLIARKNVCVDFSGSVENIFKIFPAPILGVILFLTGAQRALGSCDFGKAKNDRFVSLITAGCAIWNIGLAFVLGVATYHLLKRGWVSSSNT